MSTVENVTVIEKKVTEQEKKKMRSIEHLCSWHKCFCLGRIETRNIDGFGSNSSNGFFKH
jgi:hypothetical protein